MVTPAPRDLKTPAPGDSDATKTKENELKITL